MLFPNEATNDEKSINWRLIVELSDKDFEFNTPKKKTNVTRFCARVLLFNEKQEICVIKSEKYGYMLLPGGGIDKGECILDGLKREAREETGFLLKNIQPIGYALEKREDIKNTDDFDQSISYVFTAAPGENVGTDYMEGEIAEGFKPIWIKLDDFITELESYEGKIDSYRECFSIRRDLEIAKYYRKIIVE